MYCPKCGKENGGQANFCSACGAPLSASAPAQSDLSQSQVTSYPQPAPSFQSVTPSYSVSAAAAPAVEYAGFWRRFAAYLIDSIIFFVAFFILFGIVGEEVGNLLSIVVSWLYFALMESSPYQGTLGKQAMGIQVTDLNGNRISFGRATGRHFAKILSAIILLIGYFMAGFTAKKQALHDMIAGCLVTKKRPNVSSPISL